jgi:hypothetical protein
MEISKILDLKQKIDDKNARINMLLPGIDQYSSLSSNQID